MEPPRIAPQQPRRRVDVSLLIRDRRRRVLLIQPAHRDDMVLPGGAMHPGESVTEVAVRALVDDMGMRRTTAGVLTLDRHPAALDTGAAEVLTVVIDGGVMANAEADALSLPVRTEAIAALEWVPLGVLHEYTMPFTEHRIRAAYAAALRGIRLRLAYLGEPAEQFRAA
ncbi:NUDIX domain-containing protein [Kitasatospora sp. NPDC004669]|uniref:NUDIX domain-containing protein n=1 Tax=Kitasatospora sp. NPDC004669 TaxID=3154555 RepID=UPI0033B841F2